MTLEHALQLRLAFEMTRLGMTPERVIAFMKSNWSGVASAILDIYDRHSRASKEAVFLVLEPSALRDLQDGRAILAELVPAFVAEKSLPKLLRKSSEPSAPPTLGIVNLSAMFAQMIKTMALPEPELSAEFESHWRPVLGKPEYLEG